MESYPGGWQEVLPNGGAPSAHAGASYGQHGEVSLVPWDHAIERDDEDGVTVAFEVALRTVPLRLTKRLEPRPQQPLPDAWRRRSSTSPTSASS